DAGEPEEVVVDGGVEKDVVDGGEQDGLVGVALAGVAQAGDEIAAADAGPVAVVDDGFGVAQRAAEEESEQADGDSPMQPSGAPSGVEGDAAGEREAGGGKEEVVVREVSPERQVGAEGDEEPVEAEEGDRVRAQCALEGEDDEGSEQDPGDPGAGA